MMKLENLFNRKKRIKSKGIYTARHIVVMEDCKIVDVLQKLDYDRFHIIYILNGDMEILGTITEQHIIKALKTYRAANRVSDLLHQNMYQKV